MSGEIQSLDISLPLDMCLTALNIIHRHLAEKSVHPDVFLPIIKALNDRAINSHMEAMTSDEDRRDFMSNCLAVQEAIVKRIKVDRSYI